MRPAPSMLLRPMVPVDLLDIPVYDIKKIEASFDMPKKIFGNMELADHVI